MAKTRKFSAYRRIERPYTRTSKFRKLNYAKGKPSIKIVHFDQGNKKRKDFPVRLVLVSDKDVQIRDLALEAARQACNRHLGRTIEKGKYFLKIKTYPHHILRENPLAAGAGADRMSTGMKAAFGKVIGRAAQVRKGQELIVVETEERFIKQAKLALKKACHKFPTPGTVKVMVRPAQKKDAEAPAEGSDKQQEKVAAAPDEENKAEEAQA